MSDNPIRLRMTLTWEYEATPENYGTSDPKEMAAIDADGDVQVLVQMALQDPHHTFNIEPVPPKDPA